MGYQALLFCPDEKTTRTVTQVLSELEFSVAACTEPFAAVKKLMSDHFDALVVDCDNEQNATLLFKSARNSASNQTSLAVAVVEGQAGVAKAFRFGANLVLTKPINVEQAKGTLRVARGLLRKGEPGKPAATPTAAAQTAGTPAASAKPAVAPTPKPASPARPAAPVAGKPGPSSLPPKPVSAGAPVANRPPAAKTLAVVQPAMSHSVEGGSSSDSGLIGAENSSTQMASAPAGASPVAKDSPAQPSKLTTWIPAGSAAAAAEAKHASSVSSTGGGAASAPAPALEQSRVAEVAPSVKEDISLDKPAAVAASESHSSQGPTTTFTFGGAALQEESSGGRKKILLAVAAIALVAAGGYFGWNYYQSLASHKAAPVAITHPAQPAPPVAAPVSRPTVSDQTPPAPTAAPATSNAPAPAQPATDAAAPATQAPITTKTTETNEDSSADDAPPPTPAAKKTAPAKPAASKPAAAPAPAPLVVKGGQVSSLTTKPAANAGADGPAPSVIGMAVPGSSAPPLNLVGGTANAPKPLLEKLNVSQGVSQGLLIKKVSPTYPRTALSMRIEGSVELMATISKTGDISSVKVISGDAQLTKAAADAVKQWKYKPYLLNGEPVEIQTQVTINFRLPN